MCVPLLLLLFAFFTCEQWMRNPCPALLDTMPRRTQPQGHNHWVSTQHCPHRRCHQQYYKCPCSWKRPRTRAGKRNIGSASLSHKEAESWEQLLPQAGPRALHMPPHQATCCHVQVSTPLSIIPPLVVCLKMSLEYLLPQQFPSQELIRACMWLTQFIIYDNWLSTRAVWVLIINEWCKLYVNSHPCSRSGRRGSRHLPWKGFWDQGIS